MSISLKLSATNTTSMLRSLSITSRCQQLNHRNLIRPRKTSPMFWCWFNQQQQVQHYHHHQLNHRCRIENDPEYPNHNGSDQNQIKMPRSRIKSSSESDDRSILSSKHPANTDTSSHSNENNQDNHKNDRTNQTTDPNKASEEQLTLLSQRLANHLPNFFKVPHDFGVYTRDIIFEDNIRNVKTVGINAYAWQITKIKVGAHFKYGKITFNILKMTKHLEDSSIKLRWRIVTYPGNKIVWAFWKFKLWNVKESLEEHKDEWIDGFSILYVNGEGRIYKHVCDKIMPNTDEVEEKKKAVRLAAKLGMA